MVRWWKGENGSGAIGRSGSRERVALGPRMGYRTLYIEEKGGEKRFCIYKRVRKKKKGKRKRKKGFGGERRFLLAGWVGGRYIYFWRGLVGEGYKEKR